MDPDKWDEWARMEFSRADRGPKDIVQSSGSAVDLEALEGQTVTVRWSEFAEDVDGVPLGVETHEETAAVARPVLPADFDNRDATPFDR